MVKYIKRDSPRCVRRRQQVEIRKWNNLFTESQILPSTSQLLQLHPEIPKSTLYRRIKQAKQQKEHSVDSEFVPTFLRRNVHQQIFTVEEENILAQSVRNIIAAKFRLVTKQVVKEMARDYFMELHPHLRDTRSGNGKSFKVSEGWIMRFKSRHGFNRRKPKIIKKIKESSRADRENEMISYCAIVHEAVMKYGEDYVMNMDETPAWACEIPTKGWSNHGDENLELYSWGNDKTRITVLPTVTVSGKKLAFGWIHKAKTNEAISKMKLPGQIRSYFSHKGWINGGVMIHYLNEIVKPYMKGKPGALILDDYSAHWTPEVNELAAKMKLELILVPKCKTAELQPLDISVNGPMKQSRQKLSMENRWNNICVSDNVEETVIRAYNAYLLIKKQTIIEGWLEACPPLEDVYES